MYIGGEYSWWAELLELFPDHGWYCGTVTRNTFADLLDGYTYNEPGRIRRMADGTVIGSTIGRLRALIAHLRKLTAPAKNYSNFVFVIDYRLDLRCPLISMRKSASACGHLEMQMVYQKLNQR